MPYACNNPDTNATIQTLARWYRHYGAPEIIGSDQGSHFIASKIKKLANMIYNGIILWPIVQLLQVILKDLMD